MGLLVFYVSVALAVSFLCSVLEAVLLSVTPAYIAGLEQQEHASAEKLKRLKLEIDRPLAAILSLNTIAHTIGAAGAGAQAQVLWGAEALTVASIVLTLLILIASEIVPKTLGARHWRRLAPAIASVMPLLIAVMYPMVWLAEHIARWIGAGHVHGAAARREELAALAQAGARDRIFEAQESRVLRNLFRFGSLCASDVMTPRTVVCTLPQALTTREAITDDLAMRFSRLPVRGENADEIRGFVLKDDLLLMAARGEGDQRVDKMLRPIITVPEGIPLDRLLEELLSRKQQVAICMDEFGGFQGLVTMEDVVETLLGMEIVGETDPVEDMRALARLRWKERAKRLGHPIE